MGTPNEGNDHRGECGSRRTGRVNGSTGKGVRGTECGIERIPDMVPRQTCAREKEDEPRGKKGEGYDGANRSSGRERHLCPIGTVIADTLRFGRLVDAVRWLQGPNSQDTWR